MIILSLSALVVYFNQVGAVIIIFKFKFRNAFTKLIEKKSAVDKKNIHNCNQNACIIVSTTPEK